MHLRKQDREENKIKVAIHRQCYNKTAICRSLSFLLLFSLTIFFIVYSLNSTETPRKQLFAFGTMAGSSVYLHSELKRSNGKLESLADRPFQAVVHGFAYDENTGTLILCYKV